MARAAIDKNQTNHKAHEEESEIGETRELRGNWLPRMTTHDLQFATRVDLEITLYRAF
jgi:hypothetical protein